MQNIIDKKTIVVESIKKDGPSLPSGISKQVGLSLLFTSALLSEMVADKTLKLSYMKIGGSPLYYLPGQEDLLEKFVNHFNAQEKESFEILKERRIVPEEVLSPVNRVAMKAIKDFAYPLTVTIEGKDRVFWRLYSASLEEAQEKIKEIIDVEKNGFKKTEKKGPEIDEKIEAIQEIKEQKTRKTRQKKEKEIKENEPNGELNQEQIHQPQQISPQQEQNTQKIEQVQHIPKIKTSKKSEDNKEKIKLWLRTKHLEIDNENEDEEAPFIVSTPSTIGNISLLVVFSDKKKISEADLSIAYQKGLNYKMPVMFLINGELNKKAQEYLKSMGGYINIQKI